MNNKLSNEIYNFDSLKDKKIGIVGATGAVGAEFLKILSKAGIPGEQISLFSSKRSAGKKIDYLKDELTVEELKQSSFKGLDLALFSAGSSVSRMHRESCQNEGAALIDNSSAFRMEKGIPLVIPEINPHALDQRHLLVANPNCSTIIMLMGVFPIHQYFPVDEIIVSTYQAASGAGWEAMEELKESTHAFLKKKEFQPRVFPFPYAFNLFSHNSNVDESGYCEEELKMIEETKKILDEPNIKVAPTCIRVPVLRAHSESIYLRFKKEVPSVYEVMECFKKFPGVQIEDNRKQNHFPMPLEASEKYECLVGRIRQTPSQIDQQGIQLFISGDQLLKGAALNAVQIAKLITSNQRSLQYA